MKKFKILSVSSSRADFNYLKTFIELIDASEEFEFKLIITGTHLSQKFGNTSSEIKKSSISNYLETKVDVDEDDEASALKSFVQYTQKFSEILSKEKPDALILLGDRYETFISAGVATFLNIPLIHLHGGELTIGSFDDSYRHSITKMSKLHFTSTEVYKNRVIQMGENQEFVHNVGAFSLDFIENLDLLKKEELKKKLGIKRNDFITILVHPETNHGDNVELIKSILEATLDFKNTDFILISSNSDPGNSIIRSWLENYSEENDNYFLFSNLDFITYISLIKHSNFLLGNSSSGIIEAPFLNTFVLNIGKRQEGRVKSNLVYDLAPDSTKISKKIKELGLSTNDKEINFEHPYYKKNTAEIALNILKNQIHEIKTLKVFNDI